MAFQQGLSGLAVASKALDVSGNNIANASTVGFKQSQAHFADVYAASLSGGGASQIGIGASLAGVVQQYTQGNLTTTNNPLDIAINGSGFFAMSQNGTLTYTRNGQFKMDKDGYITNDNGLVLTGIMADSTGAIPGKAPTDELKVDIVTGAPKTTTKSTITANLDSRSLTPTGGTPAKATGANTPWTATGLGTVTLAAAQALTVSVDGTSYTVNVPAGTYTAVTAASAITKAFEDTYGTPAKMTATVTGTGATTAIQLVSGSTGDYSTIAVPTGAAATTLALNAATLATPGASNFSKDDPKTYTNSTAQTVYDSLGNAHTLTYYFVKTSIPGQWQMHSYLDGVPDDTNTTTLVTFGKDGKMVQPTAGTLPQVTYTNGPQSMGANPVTMKLDITGITQYGNSFANGTLTQDGSTSGNLSGLSIGKDGVIQARYDNGTAKTIGQIALHNFRNMNGLQAIGNNQWVATAESGSDTPGYPGTGNFGVLQAAATEDSNVDLTTELVNLIVHQRNYQASAQSIKTQDQVLQTLVNLR